MSLARWIVLLSWTACCAGAAQPLELPPPPDAPLEQRIGATLPLDLRVLDEHGDHHRLSDFIDGNRPVLLVAGYYRCPQLCGLLMHGLLDGLRASGVPRDAWRIVRFSIDPRETPADARVRADIDRGYADAAIGAAPAPALDLHLLTLAPAGIARLTRAIGYGFAPLDARDDDPDRFAHPATVTLLTPHGTVSRYFNGLSFAGPELRVALADAAGDRLGSVTGRLALLCAHFDPHPGRHTEAVMGAIRAGSLLLAAGLAGWCWRRRRGGAR